MDPYILGLVAEIQQKELREAAARERAVRRGPRAGIKLPARLVALALIAAAPLALWVTWVLVWRPVK